MKDCDFLDYLRTLEPSKWGMIQKAYNIILSFLGVFHMKSWILLMVI